MGLFIHQNLDCRRVTGIKSKGGTSSVRQDKLKSKRKFCCCTMLKDQRNAKIKIFKGSKDIWKQWRQNEWSEKRPTKVGRHQ